MIRFVVMIVIVIGVAVMFYDGQDSGEVGANDSRLETGWSELDSMLDDGLTDEAHARISNTLSYSAGTLRGWGDGLVGAVQDVAEPY
ncbi:MAG: hypothetical protein IH957_08110 [Chloroflexi bacterium]|nr:hypothetical protein [Chloroflexota bacterium]